MYNIFLNMVDGVEYLPDPESYDVMFGSSITNWPQGWDNYFKTLKTEDHIKQVHLPGSKIPETKSEV